MPQFFELAPQFQITWFYWILALLAAMIVGLSKSGIKGLVIIVVTIMAFIYGGKASTGIILPLLMVGDLIAVIYYNRHTQWKYLRRMLPWMMLGVLIGAWVGKDLSDFVFKRGMAIIIILSVFMMVWWDRRKVKEVPQHWAFAGAMGLAAGFTTMVGNLAGAFANIYFLAMRLPKDQFIGTSAWLFFFINIFKLPFHIFVWETITVETLAVNVRLIPAILLGMVVGIQILKYIKDDTYRKMVLAVTAVGAVLIFFR